MKTDKKIEIKKEFEIFYFDRIDDLSVQTDASRYVDDCNKIWEWFNERFTPNTEVQKAVEDGVESYKKGLVMFTASNIDDIEINGKYLDVAKLVFEVGRKYETYQQSLDKGDRE